VRYNKATRYVLLLSLATLAPILLLASLPRAYAAGSYTLSPVFPGYTQEGGVITLIFTVSGANATFYQFRFLVQDPSTKVYQSILVGYNNTMTPLSIFTLYVDYPSTTFPGPNSLVGQYLASVNQVKPVAKTNVATTHFFFILTDNFEYQRTQTVRIQATGYNASESVRVTIRPQSASTPLFSQTVPATATGLVATSWKIPRNATVENYIVTLTGTSTVKSPPDIQAFSVSTASMSISALSSLKSTYQRTETITFSFRSVYPDGSNATTGSAPLTLQRPDGVSITLTAVYNSNSKTFTSNYKTSVDNQTGNWKATISAGDYDDGYGNIGPATNVTSNPQLIAATLTIDANVTSYVAVGQQVQVNATIAYPDGTALQSSSGGAYLLYSGTPLVNDTVSIIFDSGLKFWVGSYTPQSTDPGGLWSLIIKASDSSTPPNSGSATKAVTFQDHSPRASFTSSTPSAPTLNSISFNATSSYDPDGTIVSWSWSFGDGATGTGSTVTHAFSSAGIYTASLTVTDNSGSIGLASSQVTITDRAPSVSSTPSSTAAYTGKTITLSITASDPDGTVSTVKVDWGDGTTDTLTGAATSDSHAYNAAGTYTIALTVTDNSGSIGSASSQVSIQPASLSPSSGNVSFPLYYFGILAAIIAALLAGGFLAFRRHRVTHAKLKIDLEAVRSEAGRIENQEFFQSVKDQLKKDKDD